MSQGQFVTLQTSLSCIVHDVNLFAHPFPFFSIPFIHPMLSATFTRCILPTLASGRRVKPAGAVSRPMTSETASVQADNDLPSFPFARPSGLCRRRSRPRRGR